LAPTLSAAHHAEIESMFPREPRIALTHDARATLHHARASVVASGTATVEAALIGNPFVVVYRVSPISYAVARRVVDVPHVAMANLIASRRVVPELIQSDFTAKNLVSHLKPLLLDEAARAAMQSGLREIAGTLSPQAASAGTAVDRAAQIAAGMLQPEELAQQESQTEQKLHQIESPQEP